MLLQTGQQSPVEGETHFHATHQLVVQENRYHTPDPQSGQPVLQSSHAFSPLAGIPDGATVSEVVAVRFQAVQAQERAAGRHMEMQVPDAVVRLQFLVQGQQHSGQCGAVPLGKQAPDFQILGQQGGDGEGLVFLLFDDVQKSPIEGQQFPLFLLADQVLLGGQTDVGQAAGAAEGEQ